MKGKVRGPATLSSAFVVVALGVLSASAQLNPTVKVLPKPQTSVPPECEQGLAPAVPRVIVAENEQQQTKPARAVPPPSLDLKTQLRSVQVAAERNDRDAFKTALADARAAVAGYPAGGERSAANDVLSVYNDLEKLWDYQFGSATGAFFDASTELVTMMRRYPDYPKTIADQTLTLNGQTVYPTDETRRFLVSEAARRLNNLGVRTPTRVVETPPPPPPKPVPQPHTVPQPAHATAPKVAEKPAAEKPAAKKPAPKPVQKAEHKPSEHKAATHKTSTSPKPPKIAEARKPAATPRKSEPAPMPAPMPVPVPVPVVQPKSAVAPPMPKTTPSPMPKTAPVVAPVPPAPKTETAAAMPKVLPSPAPKPAPVPVPEPKATATTAPLPTDTMVTTTTAQPESQTTATTATSTSTAKPAENPPGSEGKVNLLFAIILIIVGIGVLIILFRASD